MNLSLSAHSIKAEASRLGFHACGLAPAGPVDETIAQHYRQWIAEGHQGEMTYLQNYEDKRFNPCLLVEGAQTVISVALNYYPATRIPEDEYQIAWYAYGKDYHEVMKGKLQALYAFIQATLPDCELNARCFCDTAPVLERYWAWRCGLGWIGKNNQLVLPQAGSCFFLGEIILNVAADTYDTPQENRCGNCTRCLNACPTKALEAPYKLCAERCLSYLTIEYRGELPPHTGLKMGKKIYGCDECVKACPWNRFASPTTEAAFQPSPLLLEMKQADWESLTEEQYRTLFKGSAVKRAKYSGLTRNIQAVTTSKQ